MNISDSGRADFVFSAAGVVRFPKEHRHYINHDAESQSKNEATLVELRRISSLISNKDTSKFSWRIDGSLFGTRYFATPVVLPDLPPMRVDIVIPDQIDWDPNLWHILDASDSVHMHDQRVAELGISRYLVHLLEDWSRNFPDFESVYRSLPFGSVIVVEKVEVGFSNASIKITRNSELPSCLYSANKLSHMWDIRFRDMPPRIELQNLRFIRRLYTSVCLVEVKGERMIFKSNTQSPSSTYHEIKVLLSLPPHPNIIDGPKFLVTIPDDTSTQVVCGFLLEYLELGSLETYLPQKRKNGSLHLQDQIRWCMELTSALEHIHSQPGMFYSDLKMDNILLRSIRGKTSIVLVDFEQGRNLYTWAPPEVFYVEWIAELAYQELSRNDGLKEETRVEFRKIIEQYFRSRGVKLPLQFKKPRYDNPDHGWYYPWLTSTPEEREHSAVYCLGRAIWCIFEGVGDTSNVLGRSLAHESEQEFPRFTRTQMEVRKLIERCTAGAREWTNDGPLGLFRRGGKVYPRGRTGYKGEPLATAEETVQVVKRVWESEIANAKAFLAAREKYGEEKASIEDMKLLAYLERPTLKDVLGFFQNFPLPARKGLWSSCQVL
jgi:serine/threonine protein kinase